MIHLTAHRGPRLDQVSRVERQEKTERCCGTAKEARIIIIIIAAITSAQPRPSTLQDKTRSMPANWLAGLLGLWGSPCAAYNLNGRTADGCDPHRGSTRAVLWVTHT